MTTQLLLNKDTETEIKRFLAKPSHSLIIDGKNGAGKGTLAHNIASKLLLIEQVRVTANPQILKIEPTKQSISINEIREAQKFLKLKTTGQNQIRRVLIVEQAELMTVEAQNAFLKILEEPPADTVILILTSQKIKLLPTIRSRAQRITVKPVSEKVIIDNFAKSHREADITAAYHASGGQIGLMASILNEEQASPLLNGINQAKQVLAMNKFERLAFIDTLLKQKDSLQDFINSLMTVCQAAMKSTANKENMTQSKRWHHSLNAAIEAEEQLLVNANQKLLLTNLLLNL